MEEKLIELLSYALFAFWIVGCCSFLVDLDHLWHIYGEVEPINILGFYGRPLHNPIFYIFISFVISWIAVAFIYGWYVRFLEFLGIKQAIIILIVVYILTFLVLYLFSMTYVLKVLKGR